MNIKEAVKAVASKFEYREDPDFLFDYWYVMKDRNGKYKGDCEDFSLTVFWELSGKNLGRFKPREVSMEPPGDPQVQDALCENKTHQCRAPSG